MNWRPIPGFEGDYLVSDMGDVMSLSARNGRKPCVMQQSIRRGYRSVMIRRKQCTVHSLVMLAFVGPRPPGMDINHKSGVKSDNRRKNLEYCTKSQNQKHAFATGLASMRGERHTHNKLTNEHVYTALRMLGEGISQTEIANMLGVSQPAISNIKRGRSWSHLTVVGGVQ